MNDERQSLRPSGNVEVQFIAPVRRKTTGAMNCTSTSTKDKEPGSVSPREMLLNSTGEKSTMTRWHTYGSLPITTDIQSQKKVFITHLNLLPIAQFKLARFHRYAMYSGMKCLYSPCSSCELEDSPLSRMFYA